MNFNIVSCWMSWGVIMDVINIIFRVILLKNVCCIIQQNGFSLLCVVSGGDVVSFSSKLIVNKLKIQVNVYLLSVCYQCGRMGLLDCIGIVLQIILVMEILFIVLLNVWLIWIY